MKCVIDNRQYEVVIIKKNNRNTYIRVKEDLKIYVYTYYLASNSYIKKLLDKSQNEIKLMIDNMLKKNEKKELFSYLGKVYDIIIVPTLNTIEFNQNIIYVKSNEYLNKWLNKQRSEIFKERLDILYNQFEEKIPYPSLKIRKMKTRWGVCNRKNISITLNSELIKYNLDCIDYVIIHELSHFVCFDHSKNFWNIVFKYFPNYKKVRKILKEE